MITFHIRVLAALTLSTLIILTPALPAPPALPYEVLCYNTHYAIRPPNMKDCARIISDQLTNHNMTRRIIFSRHPMGNQFPLPHTYKTGHNECAVVLDMPELPSQKIIPPAEASMLDVKMAAFEVLTECVVGANHLGGMIQTGKRKNLQVRVEAVPTTWNITPSEKMM